MHVVVDVARDQEQMALEVGGDVLVLIDVVLERDLTIVTSDFSDAVAITSGKGYRG